MDKNKVLAVVNRHFEFETPELIERVIETFSDHVIWEAPARNLCLTDHHEIVREYRRIIAGIANPTMEVLRVLVGKEEVFEDRIIDFTALENNVWGIKPQQRVKLRLAHYFKIHDDKIIHEIGYEMWGSKRI